MTSEGFEQIPVITALSRQPDGLSLTRLLVGSMYDVAPSAAVAIYEIYGFRSVVDNESNLEIALETGRIAVRRFDDGSGRKHDSCSIADLVSVGRDLEPREFAVRENESSRVVIPIASETGVPGRDRR